MMGYIYYELGDLEAAQQAYVNAVNQDKLPDRHVVGLLSTLSQICLLREDYVEAERYARQNEQDYRAFEADIDAGRLEAAEYE